MIGSTIVFIPKLPKDKSNLFKRIIEEDEFEKLELDQLTTLDFAIITGKTNTKWETENNPIVYDEENGLVILHISESGLKSVLNFKGNLDNVFAETQRKDIFALQNFVAKNGAECLYEVVTF